MSDYLNYLKEISDKLAAVGEPIFESDLVTYILSSFSDDYEYFIDSIETRTESVNTDELDGMLLSKEISLQKRKTRASLSTAPFHAIVAQQGSPGSNSYRGNSRGRFQNQNRNFGANQNRNNNTSGSILRPGAGFSKSHFFGANNNNYNLDNLMLTTLITVVLWA
ncbi:hypothetical protein ACFX1T_022879 [Malus domestica]